MGETSRKLRKGQQVRGGVMGSVVYDFIPFTSKGPQIYKVTTLIKYTCFSFKITKRQKLTWKY